MREMKSKNVNDTLGFFFPPSELIFMRQEMPQAGCLSNKSARFGTAEHFKHRASVFYSNF